MPGTRTLSRWLLFGEWRAHPVRAVLAIAAIAVGVAMGFAIHLINAAAFNEFSAAIKSLAGEADVQVSGSEPWFDESVYPQLATRTGVAAASPVLLVQPAVAGTRRSVSVIGIDAMRAAFVTPGLLGNTNNMMDAIADDAIFLSPATQASLAVQPGGTLTLGASALRVAGTLQQARAGQRLAVMDIGAAQWRFGKLGQLSRVDLKLQPGVNRDAFERELAASLESAFPGRFRVGHPNDEAQDSRNNSMSRAYRVNLTVLALVALFTGAFLVFSTQALSVVRRRSQFALLRTLGVTRRQLLRQVVLEGASIGVAGALLGIAAGYGMAAAALHFFGGDLGAGYFQGVRPSVEFAPLAACVFFALGLGVAILGCLAPAFEAARAAPAVALKAGNDEVALARLARTWPSLLCLAAAGLLALAPPVMELPLPGYLAIGLLLVGGIGLMPRLAASLFGALNRLAMRGSGQRPVLALGLARLANASGQAAVALGGVLSSFSLMVAMAIMVSSFRVSLDDWLLRLLPADLYVQTSAGQLGKAEQAALAALPGAARVQFARNHQVSLSPARPDVAVSARDIDLHDAGKSLVLEGPQAVPPPGAMPVWVSEAVIDLYGVRAGGTLSMPLGGQLRQFFVAGVMRDYASQSGAIAMRLSDYRSLTGDEDISGAAIWLAAGSDATRLRKGISALPFAGSLMVAEPGQIRAFSLTIFDRSFAVTYLLEAIAIAIGLSGVAATFSAQTLARSREFGMLRHVGVSRGQVLRILAFEGGALTALGVACGFALGLVISLILVFVVNPQSFHWTMQLHLPWSLLASVAAVLLAASVATALVSGRYALSSGPVRAVREDW